MTEPVNAIDAAIAAAKAAAAATPEASTQTPGVVAVQQGGAVAAIDPNAPKLSMETIGGGSMAVDAWLKVKEHGLVVGEGNPLIDSIKAMIDMTDGRGFSVKNSIKAGGGTTGVPVTYASTYDNQISTDGKSWAETVSRMRQISPTASPYRAVDLPFVLTEDIINPKTKAVILEKGKRLGHSTATTNWAEWELFYSDVKGDDLLGKMVLVEIGFKARTNKAGQAWGIITLKNLGEAADEE